MEPKPLAPMVLRFDAARFMVRLGYTDEELAGPQEVSLAVALQFHEPVAACTSDRLHDTICYATLIDIARRCCTRKPYRLIEAMCYDLFVELRREMKPGVDLWVKLTKVAPPVPALRGGVSFAIGEWTPSA